MKEDNEDRLLRSVALQNAESIRIARQHAEQQAEATLREQANLLNLTHDAIFVFDMDRAIRYWNRAAEELYGWTAEQALGRTVHRLLNTVFPAPIEQIEAEIMTTGRWEGELVHTKKDGSQVVVASRWSLQRDESGAPVAVLETNNDITERKRAEEARQDIEQQWWAAFESNPTMYFIVDAAGTTISVNTFGAQELGYTITELVGQPVLNVFYEPDRQAVQRHANACFEQPGRMMRWEARKIRKDGTMLWVRETARAVVLKKQPVLLVVCEDITERKRAEEALRRSEEELRHLIDTIPALVWSALPDGSHSSVNRAWMEYTGISQEQSGWQAAIHPEDFERYLTAVSECFKSGRLLEDEVRFRRADGEYRWFLATAVPLRDEKGNILKCYGTLTDIDDRKRAEAFLTGEKRILEILAKGGSLAQILDGLCRLVEEQASGVLASILLLDGDRLRHGGAPSLPKAYTDAIDGAVIGPSTGSCGTAAYRGEQVIVEDIATDPLWADYRAAALPHSLRACWSTPIFSTQGKVIATFAMYYREPRRPSLHDQEIIEQITNLAGVAIERKLTQEALRRSEAYLAEAQRLTHTGSWALDVVTDRVLYWSEEMFRIFGLDPQEGAPSGPQFWELIHPEDHDRVYEHIQRSIIEKIDFPENFRIVLPDGAVKHLEVTGHPVLNANGEVVECVGTAVDVTERKQAEAERERLRQLEAALEHVNRVSMMGELAASLAHEIKQPIAAATTNAKTCLRWLLRNPPDIEEAREAVARIVKDAMRAADIIDRNRSLYLRDTPKREAVKLNELIREMIVLLHDAASRHSISIRAELDAGLPMVTADRVQMQQVLINLMLNGIEAMKEVGGELTIRSRRSEDGQVLLSVSDSGIGLPDQNAERIFDAFFTTKAQGTGMGLSISRRIVESHGGRLWATSNVGSGAIFHLALPTAPGAHP